MSKRLKVYGFLGARRDAYTAQNHSGQTREIVAAKSIAEVMRITGRTRRELTNFGGVTGNPEEVSLAMGKPGSVFWKPLNGRAEFTEDSA